VWVRKSLSSLALTMGTGSCQPTEKAFLYTSCYRRQATDRVPITVASPLSSDEFIKTQGNGGIFGGLGSNNEGSRHRIAWSTDDATVAS